MKEFFEIIIALVQAIFPYATPVQIIKGMCWAILLTANIGFLIYLVIDASLFTWRLRKDGKDFEKKMTDMVKLFTESGSKAVAESIKNNRERVDKALEEGTERINLLSKENVSVREENEFLRDKLKNMGFGEEQLKH